GEQRPAWSDGAFLPGGDLSAWIGPATRPDDDFERFVKAVQVKYPWLDARLARRLARAYGTRIAELIGPAESMADLGAAVAPGLYERELQFMQDQEWVLGAEDALWRRSKLGLHFTPAERARVADWFETRQKKAETNGCNSLSSESPNA
ncbi:MAG: hypothetical protein EOO24_64125, partial [Comamonadaceae bacterium]